MPKRIPQNKRLLPVWFPTSFQHDQTRLDPLVPKAGWYDQTGLIARGDLSAPDVREIAKAVPFETLFVVVPWRAPQFDQRIDVRDEPDSRRAYAQFLAMHASYVILRAQPVWRGIRWVCREIYPSQCASLPGGQHPISYQELRALVANTLKLA